MIAFLLNLIFSTFSALSILLSRLIFTGVAHLLVLAIQAFRVPGEAAKGGLEQVAELIKSGAEYLLELLLELVSALASALLDLLVEGISGSAAAAGSAVGGLVELTKNSFDGLLKDLPEVWESFSEMISSIISDLWNNYTEALAYVTENA